MIIGANYKGEGICLFSVWAQLPEKVELIFVSPEEKTIAMVRDNRGYWAAEVSGVYPGHRYFYSLDGVLRPDPVSFSQPDGVHGASEVVDVNEYKWLDKYWNPPPLDKMIIYELHTGTFTPEGTFAGIEKKLDYLLDLGINTIEIMPVAQFPGNRNWGYDGVYLYAVQNSYGGAADLQHLINVCHQKGIAVLLDVVYNHLGPEGNYMEEFGSYFTAKYNTPWGKALNFDDTWNDEVRNFFIGNALHWFKNFHFDGLRLDAIHAIYDFSAYPFLSELADKTAEFSEKNGTKHILIAESGLNDTRIIRERSSGGYNLDGQWSDDFHHSVHSLVTGEKNGYYMDFGELWQVEKALRDGFVFGREYSEYRKQTFGNTSADVYPGKFVICNQNHDQVGNRMLGDRLISIITFEEIKLVAGLLLSSPYVPMLYMGEEYGEDNPFIYFVSHGEADLVEAVRKGRASEFKDFAWADDIPDPQSEDTFNKSKLDWSKPIVPQNQILLNFYKKLISLRKKNELFGVLPRGGFAVRQISNKNFIEIIKVKDVKELIILINFDAIENQYEWRRERIWKKILDSSDIEWMGPGNQLPDSLQSLQVLNIKPTSIVIYERD